MNCFFCFCLNRTSTLFSSLNRNYLWKTKTWKSKDYWKYCFGMIQKSFALLWKYFPGIINLYKFSIYDFWAEHWTAIFKKINNWEMWLKIFQQLLNTLLLSKDKSRGDFISPENILMENWNISSFLTKGSRSPQPVSPSAHFTDLKETNLTALFYISLSIAYSLHRKTKMLNYITSKTHLYGKCRKRYCQYTTS